MLNGHNVTHFFVNSKSMMMMDKISLDRKDDGDELAGLINLRRHIMFKSE